MDTNAPIQGKAAAISGEGLFLLNLLFPLVPLLPLIVLHLKHRGTTNDYLRAHLVQPLIAACFSSILFIIGNLYILSVGSYRSIQALITFEIYYVAVATPLLIPGLLGLIKAMSGEIYRYPLIRKWVSV